MQKDLIYYSGLIIAWHLFYTNTQSIILGFKSIHLVQFCHYIYQVYYYLYQMARPIRPLLGSVALLRRCKSKFFRSKKDEKFCQEHPRQQWKQCPLLIDSTHYKRILVYSSSCKVELNCKQNYFNEFIINLIVIYYNTILQMQPF